MLRAVLLAAALQSLAAPPHAGAGGRTKLCLDTLGINLGATCSSFEGGRLRPDPDICLCRPGTPVIAPVCRAGEAPQAETADYDRARLAASRAGGTLVGKSYQGRSFCVSGP